MIQKMNKTVLKKLRESVAQLDDKPWHQADRVLRKRADETNRGENCTKYCEPRFVPNEKIYKIQKIQGKLP